MAAVNVRLAVSVSVYGRSVELVKLVDPHPLVEGVDGLVKPNIGNTSVMESPANNCTFNENENDTDVSPLVTGFKISRELN